MRAPYSAAPSATARFGAQLFQESIAIGLVPLHPGEQVLYEGHPSWRAILDFYIKGILATAAVCLLVAVATNLFGDETQTGFGFSVGRTPDEFDLSRAAREAADRATRLLGATKPTSRRTTVVASASSLVVTRTFPEIPDSLDEPPHEAADDGVPRAVLSLVVTARRPCARAGGQSSRHRTETSSAPRAAW